MSHSNAPKPGSSDPTVGPCGLDQSGRPIETIGPGKTANKAPDETIAPGKADDHCPSETIDISDPSKLAPHAAIDLSGSPIGFNATIDSIPSLASPGKAGLAKAAPRPEVEGYIVLSELGRGGMGVVYKARQKKLNRIVALKMVLSGAHAGQDQLARFYTEAEAVAHLQHANIVQIYEVSEHGGLPYFSLEFVDGGSLSDRIDGKPQPVDEAARQVELLSRAMAYAHAQGIVHRDLKPANVLLSKDGQPKITDFGLAKRLESDSSQTKSGTLMGTPNYMAPEQARGEVREVGPLADVYALGVILYEMLTGRTPFMGASILDTLQQVRNHEPVPPSRLQPSVPRDLETICLKCLQKEPAKRYAEAEALAEDLRRFRAGEPIVARPVAAPERLWRWCKRNKRVAALMFTVLTLLVSLAVGSSVAAIKIYREQAETERQRQAAVAARNLADEKAAAETVARQLAEDAQKEADENAKVAGEQAGVALTTLQTLIDKVQKQLDDAPGNQQLKKELLQTAMTGLNQVAQRAEKSGATGATMAAAHMKLGLIYKQLGQTEEAWKQFMRCHEITQARLQAKPDHDARKSNVAATLTVLAEMSQDLHRDMNAALDYYKQALEMREELFRHPHAGDGELDPTVVKQGLAEAYTRVGTTIFRLGNPADANEYFHKAVELRQALAEAAPDNSAIQQDLARSYHALGEMYFRLNRITDAREHYGKSLELRERFFEKDSKNFKLKQELARLYGMLGERYLRSGETAAARPLYERALVLSQELVDLDPKHVDYRRDLGIAYYRSGALALVSNDAALATEFYSKCREVRERMASEDPENVRRQMELMVLLPHCGEHLAAAEMAERLRRGTSVDSEMLIELARCYAQCAACVPENQELGERYAASAVAALSESVTKGYQDVVFIESEPDLEPLRQRPDYKSLIEKLRGSQPPAAL